MKSLNKIAALAGLSLALLAPARAITLSINDGWNGLPGGEVGTVIPASPANPDDEVGYVNDLLALAANTASGDYQTTAYDFTGSVSAVGSTGNINVNIKVNGVDQPNPDFYNVVSGYDYLLGKFGNAGVVWYLGGAEFTVPMDLDVPGSNTGGGLSHWIAFNPSSTNVPDGGTTAALVGLGLLGMSFIARRRK